MCKNRPLFDQTIELKDNAMLKHRPDLFNEWNFEKNDEIGLDVYKVTRASGRKAWWICLKCGSSYNMTIANKNGGNNKCSYCAGKKANDTNSLIALFPDVAKEWNYNKNINMTPNEVTIGSHKSVWWICNKGHEWKAAIYSRVGKSSNGCPFCAGKKVCQDNSLSTTHPSIALEWHSSLNSIAPDEVTFGSNKKAWWKCKACGEDYEAMVSNRARLNSSCPYCVNQKVNHTNSLAVLRPDLAAEWHPSKNGALSPNDVTSRSSSAKIWWLGKCGHEWDAKISDRSGKENQGCPICSGHRVLKGFNDLWTVHPKIASSLKNREDGFKLSKGSNVKVNWSCPHCDSTINKPVCEVVARGGIFCNGCSDGFSFGERFIYNLLKENSIIFHPEKVFSWSNKKRYDFYLPQYNWIIEVHGTQHYQESPFHKKGNDLKTVQENDAYKEKMAKENCIEEYIVINAFESQTNIIIESIENSILNKLLKDKNYKRIIKKSYSSLVIEACRLWRNGMRSTLLISKELGVYRYTATQYLKKGAKVGLCDYDPVLESQRSGRPLKNNKEVI